MEDKKSSSKKKLIDHSKSGANLHQYFQSEELFYEHLSQEEAKEQSHSKTETEHLLDLKDKSVNKLDTSRSNQNSQRYCNKNNHFDKLKNIKETYEDGDFVQNTYLR